MASSGSRAFQTYKIGRPTPLCSQTCSLADFDAIALSHAWGLSNGHTERVPPSPCTRQDCDDSVLIWDGERRCILCARPL
jgi:hypothetical protein